MWTFADPISYLSLHVTVSPAKLGRCSPAWRTCAGRQHCVVELVDEMLFRNFVHVHNELDHQQVVLTFCMFVQLVWTPQESSLQNKQNSMMLTQTVQLLGVLFWKVVCCCIPQHVSACCVSTQPTFYLRNSRMKIWFACHKTFPHSSTFQKTDLVKV